MKRKYIMAIVLFFVCLPAFAQEAELAGMLRNANRLYRENRFVEAEKEYRHALKMNNRFFETHFNLGNALYRQGKFEEAIAGYEKALALVTDTDRKKRTAAVWHNIGNAYFQLKNADADKGEKYVKALQKSIEAFRQSLRQNPADDSTRYNLALAQTLLKRLQQPATQAEQQPDNKISDENMQQIIDAFMQDEQEVQKTLQQQHQATQRPQPEKDW